ncbi:MAG: DUF4349 domain-containing protein [Armatimonadota bacterium]|jgi:type II secretory pathway pseudopilin PulG
MLEREPCEQWIERVSAYADGELADAAEREVAAHLDSCAACSEWLEQVRADRSEMVATLSGQQRRGRFARAVMKQVAEEPAHGTPRSRRPWYRLTLVELGAGVAILCICAVIIAPVFMKAREKARQTQSLSNLKQLGMGMMMYSDDHDDTRPSLAMREPPAAGARYEYADGHAKWLPDSWPESSDAYDLSPYTRNRGIVASPLPARLAQADSASVVADKRPESLDKEPPELDEREHSLGAPTRNYGLAEKLRIAYEAAEEVEVENVHGAMVQAEQEIKDRDGFLLASDLMTEDERTQAQIIFRVPSEALLDTMNALAKLGTIVDRHVRGEDLTETYIAAEGAVESEAQKQERLRRIDRRAYRSTEKLGIAEKIDASHAEAEKKRGEIRGILGRTVLATGTVRFLEPEQVARKTLLAAAERAWRSSGRTGRAVATVAVWVLAYLPFWGGALALFFLGRHLLRRRRE